jgi:uncharacterized glyoxalase superfamily protein PhnB
MLIPATRYRDCEAALRFMTDVLGLIPHAVHRNDNDEIVHAEMRLGSGIMMFGPTRKGGFDAFMVSPLQAKGETTTIYAVVDNVQALHARVVAAGAEIIMPLVQQDYGGSNFSLRDSEDHIWSFGDYDPGSNRD